MATLDYVDDEWLLGILNHKDHLWLMQGRPKGAVVSNLRDALQRAHELSAAGGTVISISRLRGGDVKIFPIQIYRLWKVADRSDGSLLIALSSPERKPEFRERRVGVLRTLWIVRTHAHRHYRRLAVVHAGQIAGGIASYPALAADHLHQVSA